MATEERVQAFADQAQRLLPPGLLWRIHEGSVRRKLLEGVGVEGATLEEDLDLLHEEADPRTAALLLPEWESELAIPGECGELAPTIQGRRANVFAKLTGRDPVSIADFVAFAGALGFEVEIEEHRPFEVGRSVVGEELSNTPPGWPLTWVVHAPLETPRFFSAGGSAAGEALVEYGSERLECEFQRARPAHTLVLFVYDLAYEGWAPWKIARGPAIELDLEAPAPRITIG